MHAFGGASRIIGQHRCQAPREARRVLDICSALFVIFSASSTVLPLIICVAMELDAMAAVHGSLESYRLGAPAD